jgi:ribonuclease toxin BrnT of type II toxin-antitoxin system
MHGVGFAEAATVLDDEHAITREDEDSVGEQRFVTLGLSGAGNLLVVVYSWRGRDGHPDYFCVEGERPSKEAICAKCRLSPIAI